MRRPRPVESTLRVLHVVADLDARGGGPPSAILASAVATAREGVRTEVAHCALDGAAADHEL